MAYQQITIEQIEQLNQISDPVARRRYGILFQMPQDIQDIFESENTTNTIWDITKVKYNLSNGNISAVARIIGLIFLGELPIKNFIVALQKDLGVDMLKAQAIAQDINQAIFQPVRESLMLVHGIQTESRKWNVESGKNKNPNPPPFMTPHNQSAPQPPPSTFHNPPPNEPQKRREDVLNKIRPNQNNQQPNQTRPMMFKIAPPKNVIDLRFASVQKKKKKRENHYGGFFIS